MNKAFIEGFLKIAGAKKILPGLYQLSKKMDKAYRGGNITRYKHLHSLLGKTVKEQSSKRQAAGNVLKKLKAKWGPGGK